MPALPHVALVCVAAVTQLVPWQQPPAQDDPVHAHDPATHACPDEHVLHARPPLPHAPAAAPVWHMPVASQQPVGQVVLLHAPHVWLVVLHVRPAGQSVPALQPHTPPARQRCPVRLVVQFAHTPPGAPHAAGVVPDAQLPDAQQPVVHVPLPAPPHAVVHAPAEHVGLRPVHAAHDAPPVPHVALSCAAVSRQLFPWQQPAHDAALHTHAPAEHA